jgi:hypothetical protein
MGFLRVLGYDLANGPARRNGRAGTIDSVGLSISMQRRPKRVYP